VARIVALACRVPYAGKPIFLGERPRSPIPTCFWHQSLLRRRRARSAEGMGIRCIGLFAFSFVHFTEGVDSQIDNSAVANGDLLSLTSLCRSAIFPARSAAGFHSSSAARLSSSPNSRRCSRLGHRAILHSVSGGPTLFHSATSPTPALSADFSGIFFLLRTSPMTYPYLLLASEPAPQAKCQKCQRHRD